MGDQYHPNGSGVENDLSRHTPSTGPMSVWTAPRATGDIDVERDRLNDIAGKLKRDLAALEADIQSFASANSVSGAYLGISEVAQKLKASSGQTHGALLEAMVRLRFAYVGVINGLQNTRTNYENAEDQIEAYIRRLGA
ncbi:hypothetical protein [Actinocorallia populi]|uniref:hypothetical protein n=1 Tax=Actinocorallia populi TaxID=2079200 RepID=UPI000D08CC4C|nr:hypothetical protein [Actinocorallia populi]